MVTLRCVFARAYMRAYVCVEADYEQLNMRLCFGNQTVRRKE